MKKNKLALIMTVVFSLGLIASMMTMMVLAMQPEVTAANVTAVGSVPSGYSFTATDVDSADKQDIQSQTASMAAGDHTFLGAVFAGLAGASTLDVASQRIQINMDGVNAGDSIQMFYKTNDFFVEAQNIVVSPGSIQADIEIVYGLETSVAVYWKQAETSSSSSSSSSSTTNSGSTSSATSSSGTASPVAYPTILNVSSPDLDPGLSLSVKVLSAEEVAALNELFKQNGASGMPIGFYEISVLNSAGEPVQLSQPVSVVLTLSNTPASGSRIVYFNQHNNQVLSGDCIVSGNTATVQTKTFSPFGFYYIAPSTQGTTAISPQTGVFA